MASSSENSFPQAQGSQEQVRMDEKRLRRKLSNRESARRSRMRKQAVLDDLTAEIDRLKRENGQIISAVSATSYSLMSMETENSVIRAQAAELTQRLESLNSISELMGGGGGGGGGNDEAAAAGMGVDRGDVSGSFWNDLWINSAYGNGGGQIQQVPIVASSAAMFPF